MMDLETWGTRPGAALRSIGAVVFSLDGAAPEKEQTFYRNIDLESQTKVGLTVEQNTRDWWGRQGDAAVRSLLVNQRPFMEVLYDFNKWWREQRAARLWCQGASFDAVLWEAASLAAQVRVPWMYYNVMDTRTLYHIAKLDARTVKRDGTSHHALDDARHQVVCCRQACAKLCPPMEKS
jgi:hypothetical protein